MKSSFMLYVDQYSAVKDFTLKQKGMLFDAIFEFATGNAPVLSDPLVKLAFSFFRLALERDAEKYERTCRKNRENINKRYAKDTSVYDRNEEARSYTNATDNDSDSDKDSDSDSDKKNTNTYSASASPSAPPDAARADAASLSPQDEMRMEAAERRPDSAEIRPEEAMADPPPYRTKKGRKLSGMRLRAFERFMDAFAYRRGKADAADAWLDIPQLTNALVNRIVAAAEREAAARPQLVALGRTPKMAQGWISARRWEDEDDAFSTAPPQKTLEQMVAEKQQRKPRQGVRL